MSRGILKNDFKNGALFSYFGLTAYVDKLHYQAIICSFLEYGIWHDAEVILSDQDVQEYQDLHKSAFGDEISKEKAYDQAVKLLTLVGHIYVPMTEEEFDFFIKERREHYKALFASKRK
jgi:hypothetical protein